MTAADDTARPPWLPEALYPFESHYADIHGARVHYVDEGKGPPLLLLHGNPTWSFLYRELIKGLRDQFRCIAPDHPGSPAGPSSPRSNADSPRSQTDRR
jgi:haloalkane dehalogenase